VIHRKIANKKDCREENEREKEREREREREKRGKD